MNHPTWWSSNPPSMSDTQRSTYSAGLPQGGGSATFSSLDIVIIIKHSRVGSGVRREWSISLQFLQFVAMPRLACRVFLKRRSHVLSVNRDSCACSLRAEKQVISSLYPHHPGEGREREGGGNFGTLHVCDRWTSDWRAVMRLHCSFPCSVRSRCVRCGLPSRVSNKTAVAREGVQEVVMRAPSLRWWCLVSYLFSWVLLPSPRPSALGIFDKKKPDWPARSVACS